MLIKKAIQQRCTRGRIDITVTVQAGKGRAGSVNLDQPLAKQYHQALRTLKKSLKLSGPIDLALMAGFRDVLSVSDQPAEDPKLAKLAQQLTTQALSDLEGMRTREGKASGRGYGRTDSDDPRASYVYCGTNSALGPGDVRENEGPGREVDGIGDS